MKIAQVAPLYESVPPKRYGGTERVVSYLTEELVRLGHDVTLFATADSSTSASLSPQSPEGLRAAGENADPLADHLLMLERVCREAEAFDVVHFHTGYLHFPFCRRLTATHATTLHGRLDLPYIAGIFRAFSELPFVSISDAQREYMPWLNFRRTIHHGLPRDLYSFVEEPKPYLAFVGRISPEKRVDRAIEIARRLGLVLKIGAKIDDADHAYYEAHIKHMMQDPLVEFLGEIGDQDKHELIGNALALLFPIDWPEPFGLVMIEAMACGTPVIAFPGGSVREVIEENESGHVVRSIKDAVLAIERMPSSIRRRCRARFEARFTALRMAQDHLALYEELADCTERSDEGHRRGNGGRARSVLGPPPFGLTG